MARVSTKANKNIYQTTREGLKLTREAASELLETIAPEASWYIGHGWRYKDAEPSEAALIFTRIVGGIAIAAGIILLFV